MISSADFSNFSDGADELDPMCCGDWCGENSFQVNDLCIL